jgi:KRAB domain-containing zinc finger protein
MNNQQFHNAISNEEYNTEVQTNSVVTAIDSTIPVDVTISVEEEKLFNCHLNFEEQSKNVDKNSEVVSCDTQSVACTQELIPVTTSLIDSVCHIEADINNSDNGVKNDVSYYTYMTKDDHETIAEEGNSLEKRTSSRKLKVIQNDAFESEEIEHDYYEPDSDSQNQEETKFKCDTCSKFYSTQKGLRKHQLIHEKQHKCEICSKTFCKLENLEKHKNIHTLKPHACQLCHASFSKSQSLVKHLKSHTDKVNDIIKQINSDDPKEEIIIKKNSKSEDDTEDDSGNGNEPDCFENAPEIFKCEVCGQYCSTLKNLKRHALIHGERKYSCTVCKKWFFRPDTLKKHAERHGHGLLDNLADDNKLYDSDDDLFLHTASSTATENDNSRKEESEEEGNGEYKCQHCVKVMSTKKGLRRHVAMHKPKPEPAVCEICKKVCASRARLTLHQKTHNKPKEKVPREYLCHICSKVYPSNSSLTYHMRTHTGVKPHVCKTCNSGFTTTTSLANHIRIHTGDKPFVCHVCSAAFAVSSAFRRHLTRHTGEANYLCKTCGKAFKRLSTLKEHTYTHSGEKPYVCKTCGAAYSHSGSLFAHQKRCRVQYTEMVVEDHHHTVAHHIHVNNVQSAVRSLAVIGQMF